MLSRNTGGLNMATAFAIPEIGKVALSGLEPEADLSPDEARQLAKKLLVAADEVDQWNKDVDEYFKANPSKIGDSGIPF